MTLWLLLDSALRSLALGAIVWLGLKVVRVRNPQIELTAWTVVLAAALTMPLLLQIVTVTIPNDLPVPVPVASVMTAQPASIEAPSPAADLTPGDDAGIASPPPAATTQPFNWEILAREIYLLVAGLLLLRLSVSVAMTWRLLRAARPVREDWVGSVDVRICDKIDMPVTFGRIVLLPADCVQWTAFKQQAVLSHERSHIARGDYVVLLLASLHRAIFWFNPLSWRLLSRLAALMEAASDDMAIADLRDRVSYAEALLDIAARGGHMPAGVAMARPSTVTARIARILRENTLPATLGWRGRALVAASLLPATATAAVTIVRSLPTESLQPFAEAMPLLGAAELAPISPESLAVNLLTPPRIQYKVLPVSPAASASVAPASLMSVRPVVLVVVQEPASPPATPTDAHLPSQPSSPSTSENAVPPVDVSGTWEIFGYSLERNGITGNEDRVGRLKPDICTFSQTGNKLSGVCWNTFFKNTITGSVNGQSVHFDWDYWFGVGRHLTNPAFQLKRTSFDGTLRTDGKLRGTYKSERVYRPEPGIYSNEFWAEKRPAG